MSQVGKYDQALQILEKINETSDRMSAASRIAIELVRRNNSELALSLWKEGLIRFQKSKSYSDTFFFMLYLWAPFICKLDRGETLWEIYKAIEEIENWWRI
jgi:hypothetical protein